jgi:hypothetical protein
MPRTTSARGRLTAAAHRLFHTYLDNSTVLSRSRDARDDHVGRATDGLDRRRLARVLPVRCLDR